MDAIVVGNESPECGAVAVLIIASRGGMAVIGVATCGTNIGAIVC